MPESIEPRVIYGDGTHAVSVDAESVTISEPGSTVVMSREAFREVVLGWERLHEEEAQS